MIGTVEVCVQSKFPAMPLDPMQAFVGSPSSIRVRNVPKKIGDWQITSVKFVVVYPDASIKNTTCRLVGGVWVGTVEGTLTSGTSKNGYSIFADGIDENGNDVVGYCLGKGDVEILKADGTIDPDAPAFYVKLLEEQSEDPKPGEMWFNDGELNIVDANGDVQTFGQPDLSEYREKLDLDVYEKVIAPWNMTGIEREFVWDETEGRWVFDDGNLYGIYFNSSNSTWHLQSLSDEWTDVNTPIEAASDVLELEWNEAGTFTRPYVDSTHATSDKLAKVSQLPTNVAKKGDPVSEFFNDANYLKPNTVNNIGTVQKVWNGNFQTATQYINGDCEVWGHYNRTEWDFSDGIYREPHVRYDEEGFDDYHWLVYVDVIDFTPMPNCWYETESDALNTTEFSFAYGQEQEYVDAIKGVHEGWEKTGDLVTDNTKLFNATGNQYVTGDCQVFKQETIFSPWSFSDGGTREVEVFYQEEPYPDTPWVICGSDCATLPFQDCFYSTKEAAETTLSFTYPVYEGGEYVEVHATRTRSQEWVMKGTLATSAYVDS